MLLTLLVTKRRQSCIKSFRFPASVHSS